MAKRPFTCNNTYQNPDKNSKKYYSTTFKNDSAKRQFSTKKQVTESDYVDMERHVNKICYRHQNDYNIRATMHI